MYFHEILYCTYARYFLYNLHLLEVVHQVLFEVLYNVYFGDILYTEYFSRYCMNKMYFSGVLDKIYFPEILYTWTSVM
jgi:hypothetical protein